ncbi:MAG: cysteine desulfurase NifS [Sphaerochaetaceae bacterium]|nr:cysteine desulfurase NifS [Sphaerochaetaceae bacterium]NLO60376.1 cysteine desulfurase NifS [Spirochaetales bacterium]MDD2406240.1 cysteine desulfurase NifS [Sphaerochaetaceae bacterium]MDD4258786.1 cysteine desulfurase NifS [Sphaerochaetaceae bacterium]MDD4762880.1 cysteine desulfurase NifS [Sphaerochaetaceae bacterium]
MKTVYLDNNATTEVAKEVLEAMDGVGNAYGNASSMHAFGRESSRLIEQARHQIAKLIGSDDDEIIFTSGGTESDNTVFSIARDLIDQGSERKKIVTSSIEHPAIIETCRYLVSRGYLIQYVPVDATGKVKLDVLEKLLGDDVLLVSIMAANNETGTIQDIKNISSMAHACGALFHTDAVQAVGKLQVDVHDMDIDYLSLSGHKFHGPKGIGALYIRKGVPFEAFVKGGHQEQGRRAGTYNTAGIVGLGKAAELALAYMNDEHTRLWDLREKLRKEIQSTIPEVTVNGHPYDCLPGTLNVSFARAEGESILLMLDLNGIAVSTGSACATGSLEPSYVLLASGLDIELAHGSIRFSLGRFTTEADIEYVLRTLPPIIKRLREISTL